MVKGSEAGRTFVLIGCVDRMYEDHFTPVSEMGVGVALALRECCPVLFPP